jgi:hypothetical protein
MWLDVPCGGRGHARGRGVGEGGGGVGRGRGRQGRKASVGRGAAQAARAPRERPWASAPAARRLREGSSRAALAEVARGKCHSAGPARPQRTCSTSLHVRAERTHHTAQVQPYRRSSARQSRRSGCARACTRRPQPAARPPAASQPFQDTAAGQRQNAKGASSSPERSAASHACPRARQARARGERHPYVCKSRPSTRGVWKRRC